MEYTQEQAESEAVRLFEKLGKAGWTEEDCLLIAPLTLEINALLKETKRDSTCALVSNT